MRSLEIQLADPVLGGGSVIRTAVSGSGMTTVDVRLELIQGERSELLAAQRVPGAEWAFFDPRPRAATQSVSVTPVQLARFENGAAKARATATGARSGRGRPLRRCAKSPRAFTAVERRRGHHPSPGGHCETDGARGRWCILFREIV